MSQEIDGGPIYESDFSLDSAGRLWESTRVDTPVLPLPPLVARAFSEPKPFKVVVYMDDETSYTYVVDTLSQARAQVATLFAHGVYTIQAGFSNILINYPPHRVLKAKIIAPEAIDNDGRFHTSGT